MVLSVTFEKQRSIGMWQNILKKIDLLRELDSTYQVFGASSHKYKLYPTVSEEEMKLLEAKLEVELPEELRRFYLEVGNGRVGPDYGLLSLRHLDAFSFKPALEYPGYLTFKKMACENGYFSMEEDYFEVSHDKIYGLLGIADEGCGHTLCVASIGPRKGLLTEVSCDGCIADQNQTLIELYDAWADKWIGAFLLAKELLTTNLSASEISREIKKETGLYNGADIMSSLIKAAKPEELFGSPGTIVVHAAVQEPWYEKVLKEYRASHGLKG